MKAKKKLLIALLSATFITAGAFALSACSEEQTPPANGKSAYELAVENGFEGTEAQWLASLKGENGEQGEQGKSAYEIYCESLGDDEVAMSLEDWLASLKGDTGDTGEQGEQGEPGTPAHVHNFEGSDQVTLIDPTYSKPGLVYVTCQEEGCDEIKLVPITGAGYKITVVDNDGEPVEGVEVTVKGVKVVTSAEGEAIIEEIYRGEYDIELKTDKLTASAGKTTADSPDIEVTLPQFLEVTQQPTQYDQSQYVQTITKPGLYCFKTEYITPTVITLQNDKNSPLKYTVTMLDGDSSYYNGEDFLKDAYDVYVRGGDSLGGGMFNSDGGIGALTIIRVTCEDTADGTVNTPIPVQLGQELTLGGETVYYSLNVGDRDTFASVTAPEGSSVKWLGTDITSVGETLSGRFLIDCNLTHYFTATGTGKASVVKEYVDGEDIAHAIAITKGTEKSVTIGELGGFRDTVRYFAFTGEATDTHYLTIASQQDVSYIVYESINDGKNTKQIANEDRTVLPVEVEEGKQYFVRVTYKGEYDETLDTAQLTVLLRDYIDDDALDVDNGQLEEDPFVLQTTEDTDYSNRKSGAVSFLWGSSTNDTRYLVYTAAEEGEFTFVGLKGGNCTLFSDAFQTEITAANTDYGKQTTADGDVCTLYMQANETVYIRITGVTSKDVTAACYFTVPVPVDYTVVVTDNSGNKLSGISVELWKKVVTGEGDNATVTEEKAGDDVTTNADGEAVFTGLDPAEYTVKIAATADYNGKNTKLEKSYIPVTTEVALTALAQYTVVFDLPDGVEASAIEGVTVSLSGTAATGVIANGSVTFAQKVKPGSYTIVVEAKDGYLFGGAATTSENTTAHVAVTKIPDEAIRGLSDSDVVDSAKNAAVQVTVGNNIVATTASGVGYVWFAAEAGTYTFTTTNDNGIYHLYKGSITRNNGYIRNGSVGKLTTGSQISEDLKTATITLTEAATLYIEIEYMVGIYNLNITKTA